MNFKTLISIDPGRSNGGMVIFEREKNKLQVMKPEIEFISILNKFREIKSSYPGILAGIEKVNMWPSDKAVGKTENAEGKIFRTKKLEKHFNDHINVFQALQIPYIEISSKKWRKSLNLYVQGETDKEKKTRNKEFVKQVFPDIKVTLWNQDALCLIAFISKCLVCDIDYIFENLKNY